MNKLLFINCIIKHFTKTKLKSNQSGNSFIIDL